MLSSPWCGSKLETITGYTSLRNERNTSNARASHRFVHAPCVQVNPWPSSKGRCDDCLTRGVVHVRICRGAIAGPSKLYRCVGRGPAVRMHGGAAVGGTAAEAISRAATSRLRSSSIVAPRAVARVITVFPTRSEWPILASTVYSRPS